MKVIYEDYKELWKYAWDNGIYCNKDTRCIELTINDTNLPFDKLVFNECNRVIFYKNNVEVGNIKLRNSYEMFCILEGLKEV